MNLPIFLTREAPQRRLLLHSVFLLLLTFFVTGCFSEPAVDEIPAIDSTVVSATLEPSQAPPTDAPSLTPIPTQPAATSTSPPSPSPLPTETAEVIASVVEAPPLDLSIKPDKINIYPVPKLYAGDLATFQIGAYIPEDVDPFQVEVEIKIDGERIVYGTLNGRNLGGETLGLYAFAWDTTYQAGQHVLEIRLDPSDKIQQGDENLENNVYSETISVALDKYRPLKDQNAEWISRATEYADIHVVKGTAAARDLDYLAEVTNQSILKAIQTVQETPNRRYDLYFIDRVIGQGGYAGGSIVISYLDRNYAGGRIEEVITHETIHLLDQQFTPFGRLVFLAEGMAVWGAGGHYKPEDLDRRAAALIKSGGYIPLEALINNFYPAQHEIGYLQAGAFVKYLIDVYGYDRFRTFYSQFNPKRSNTYSGSLNQSLLEHYQKTLSEIEQEWLTHLSNVPIDDIEIADLDSTIHFYEVMRRYQIAYDPTAHFLQAWLPNPTELYNLGLTAELTRHPEEEINLILEAMLTEADMALLAGDYQETEVLLGSVERILDNGGVIVDPLAQAYKEIVMRADEQGYEVQRILLTGSEAEALVTNPYTPEILSLRFVRDPGGWLFIQ